MNGSMLLQVRKDHWKGMSTAQRDAILAEQLQQMDERRAAMQAKVQEEEAAAAHQRDIQRQLEQQVMR